MRVLITGAEGFIGRHLTMELQHAGHDVHACDLADGDLRDPGLARRLFKRHQPERVVHLAAKVGRLPGERDMLETISVNVGGTAAVAWACGAAGIPLTYASSSEVYGDGGVKVWHENELYQALPHNTYGLSKRQGEEFCSLYAPEGLQIACLSMPYGPGLQPGWGRAALVNFLDWALRRQPLIVHQGAERSWCYVADTARGLRLLLESEQAGRWNVGRDDDPRSLAEVADLACELTGAPESLIRLVEPPREHLSPVKRLSVSKLVNLGWKPKVDLREGMTRTLEWLQAARNA